jgi:hypothetical protein
LIEAVHACGEPKSLRLFLPKGRDWCGRLLGDEGDGL